MLPVFSGRGLFKSLYLILLRLTVSKEVGEKSSHYGLKMLGYTCATKAETKGRDGETQSKSLKTVPVRIVDWNSST